MIVYNYVRSRWSDGDDPIHDAPTRTLQAIESWLERERARPTPELRCEVLADEPLALLALRGSDAFVHVIAVPERFPQHDVAALRSVFETLHGKPWEQATSRFAAGAARLPQAVNAAAVLDRFARESHLERIRWRSRALASGETQWPRALQRGIDATRRALLRIGTGRPRSGSPARPSTARILGWSLGAGALLGAGLVGTLLRAPAAIGAGGMPAAARAGTSAPIDARAPSPESQDAAAAVKSDPAQRVEFERRLAELRAGFALRSAAQQREIDDQRAQIARLEERLARVTSNATAKSRASGASEAPSSEARTSGGLADSNDATASTSTLLPASQPGADLPAVAAAPRPKPSDWAGPHRVIADAARLRAEPSLASEVRGRVRRGDALQVVARSGDWLQVAPSRGLRTSAWIHRSLVERDVF